MHRTTSLITAAAFLLHVLLGCCAHHAHAGTEGAYAAAKTHPKEGHSDHKHSHGHCHAPAAAHSDSDSPAPAHPDHSHGDCDQTDCSFWLSGKSVLDLDSLIATMPLLAPDRPVSLAATVVGNWIYDTGGPGGLSVRLHLLHQVWLI